jgi:hypothetical protein
MLFFRALASLALRKGQIDANAKQLFCLDFTQLETSANGR